MPVRVETYDRLEDAARALREVRDLLDPRFANIAGRASRITS